MTVAALYIDPRGPYPEYADHVERGLCCTAEMCMHPELDLWDVTRDARLYDGPHPVVAHPPCGPWGRLRHLYRGNEHDCAPRAVEQVRRWGGVLEHPAGSTLWQWMWPCPESPLGHTSMPEPGSPPDAAGGYTIEVDQCEWGHVARKRTWLYLVGVPRSALEAPPFPGREPTHWVSGGRGRAGKKAKTTPVPPGIKVCSAQQRRRTPPLFAEYLVRLARAAGQARDGLSPRALPVAGESSPTTAHRTGEESSCETRTARAYTTNPAELSCETRLQLGAGDSLSRDGRLTEARKSR